MRDLIAAELKRTPDLSDNWLAQILGSTDKTVAAVRQELIATSEIPKLNALRGKDGKYRRVTRITTNTAKEAERAHKPSRSSATTPRVEIWIYGRCKSERSGRRRTH